MITALSIAGSDPTGGAGLELDLKVFQHLGVHGMAIATALTVQDADRVHEAGTLSAESVARRLDVLLDKTTPSAIKLGMLGSGAIASAVADRIERLPESVHLVIDPVILSTSGACLLDDSGVRVVRERLMRRAAVICPNLEEARRLAESARADAREAAAALLGLGARAVCVTGGDQGGPRAEDYFADARSARTLSAERVAGVSPHGTGCAFSAAIAASLAHGANLPRALDLAKRFIGEAIRAARPLPAGASGRTTRSLLNFSGPPAVS